MSKLPSLILSAVLILLGTFMVHWVCSAVEHDIEVCVHEGSVKEPSASNVRRVDHDGSSDAWTRDQRRESMAELLQEESSQGEYSGRILRADGSPAAGLSYWLGERGFFECQTGPDDTKKLQAPGLPSFNGEEFMDVEEEEEEEGVKKGGKTDSRRFFSLTPRCRDQGYLWVASAEDVYGAFDLRNLSSGTDLGCGSGIAHPEPIPISLGACVTG